MAKVGYSLVMRKNPAKRDDPNEPLKAYATLQLNDVMNIEQLARHMSEHNSKYNRADICAVLMQCVDCMKEKFIEGNKISLGDLGTFTPSISCEGAESMEKFTADNIKSYNINFIAGPYLKNLKDSVQFEYVATRKAQQATAKAQKAGESIVDLDAAKANAGAGGGDENEGGGGEPAGGGENEEW